MWHETTDLSRVAILALLLTALYPRRTCAYKRTPGEESEGEGEPSAEKAKAKANKRPQLNPKP